MRPIEILMSCVVLAIAVCLLLMGSSPAPAAAIGLLALMVGLVVAHLVFEGAHWQLVPLYLAEALLCVLCLFGARTGGDMLLRAGGVVCLLLTIAALAVSWMVPMFRLPRPAGPHRVGTRILYMVDPARDAAGERRPGSQRELMVQLWYPAEPVRGRREVYRRRAETTFKSSYQSVLRTHSLRDAPLLASAAPCPLLIFNPAWTGQRTQSTFLMQELASHGFVVASIDHTCYSGLVAFPDGRVLDGHMAPALGDFTHLSVAEGLELGDQFVRILAEDVIFVVDRMNALKDDPQSAWHMRLDMARVGALGHSVGGAAAAEACYLDPRIGAALNLDGWTFGEVLRAGLRKPWMVIYGKGIEVEPRDLIAQPEGAQRYWQMNRENYAAVEARMREHGGTWLTIRGASHWNFSDRPLYSPLRSRTTAGTIRPERAYAIICEAARAFFTAAFAGEEMERLGDIAKSYEEAELLAMQTGENKVSPV
jgi:Platelet-activating factor acetylhydrolase, isoform II